MDNLNNDKTEKKISDHNSNIEHENIDKDDNLNSEREDSSSAEKSDVHSVESDKLALKDDKKDKGRISINSLLNVGATSQINKNSRAGIALFVSIAVIYLTVLAGVFTGTILLLIVPFLMLNFIQHTGKNPVPYIALTAIVIAGALMSSYYVALFFILATVVPTLILRFTHKVEIDVTESAMSYAKEIPNKGAPGEKTQLRVTLFPFGKVSFLPVLLAPLPLAALMALLIALSPEFVSAFSEIFIQQLEALYEPALSSDLTRLDSNNPVSVLYQNRHELVTALVSLSPAVLYAYIGMVIFFTQKLYYKMPYSYITRLPDAMLALAVVSGLLVIVPILTGNNTTTIAGYNLLIATIFIFFCRGFDVVQYNLNRLQFSNRSAFFGIFKYMIYFLMLTSRNFMIGAAVVGLISLYRNLTKKIEIKTDDKQL